MKKYRNNKLAPVVCPGIFIGYDEVQVGYYFVWDVEDKKPYRTRDVTFDENSFTFGRSQVNLQAQHGVSNNDEHTSLELLELIYININADEDHHVQHRRQQTKTARDDPHGQCGAGVKQRKARAHDIEQRGEAPLQQQGRRNAGPVQTERALEHTAQGQYQPIGHGAHKCAQWIAKRNAPPLQVKAQQGCRHQQPVGSFEEDA